MTDTGSAGGAASPLALPPDHPQRFDLHNEVHARPPTPVRAPARITFLALRVSSEQRGQERVILSQLADEHGVNGPQPGFNYYYARLRGFDLKCERHTEFTRYEIICRGPYEIGFSNIALNVLPAGWVRSLPGEVLAAINVHFWPQDQLPWSHVEDLSQAYFDNNPLIGAEIGGGAGHAFTDFKIYPDGFSRALILDHDFTPRQAGRTMQRIVEIDTYRMLALLAFPIAKQLLPFLQGCEEELVEVTSAMAEGSSHNDAAWLERLTRISAQIENSISSSQSRFSAANAYSQIIHRRITELREVRLVGAQTFSDFTERRLEPAMQTCRATNDRLVLLSESVMRASQLLGTRVDMARQAQNQELLSSMNRRAALQLRLQQTVESLSLAAITYYAVGLAGYVAYGLKESGWPINPNLVKGLAVPVLGGLIWYSIHRVKRMLEAGERKP